MVQGSQLVTFDEDWRKTFRPDIPSAARVYDYLLGGKDNYPADRTVAESMITQLPNVKLAVQWNRAFLCRAVRYLVNEVGIRQIIDIGAGLPTVRNTHEIRWSSLTRGPCSRASRTPRSSSRTCSSPTRSSPTRPWSG